MVHLQLMHHYHLFQNHLFLLGKGDVQRIQSDEKIVLLKPDPQEHVPSALKGIQTAIDNLITKIDSYLQAIQSYVDAVTNTISDLQVL